MRLRGLKSALPPLNTASSRSSPRAASPRRYQGAVSCAAYLALLHMESSALPVPTSFVVCLRRIASFARAHTLLEESALHGVARECERCSEVLARGLVPPAAQRKLAERCGVKRIGGEVLAVGDGVDRCEPTLGALVLRDRDGAVEGDDRGRTDRHERIVGHCQVVGDDIVTKQQKALFGCNVCRPDA